MTIGELSARAGIRSSAVRYYESIGLVPEAPRTSGRRIYGHEALERVVMIRTASEAGLSLDEIRTLLVDAGSGAPFSEAVRNLARHKVKELDERMSRLRALRDLFATGAECGCLGPHECAVFLKSIDGC